MSDEADPLRDLLGQLLTSIYHAEWGEVKEQVQEHRDLLLSPRADELLVELRDGRDDMFEAEDDYEVLRQILSACRGQDVDTVFAPYLEQENRLRRVEQIDLDSVLRLKSARSLAELSAMTTAQPALLELPGVLTMELMLFLQEVYQASETMANRTAAQEVVQRHQGWLSARYAQALAVWEREPLAPTPEMEASVAVVLANVSTILYERPQGRQSEIVELARQGFELATRVLTSAADPQRWASIQNNLGNIYRDRVAGDRTANSERAIEHYKEALSVRTRESDPTGWAMTHNNLATAYVVQTTGARADNLEQALHHLDEALQLLPADAPERATALSNRGNVLTERERGDREQNIERALESYADALGIFWRQQRLAQWAMVQHNMGNAYLQRVTGERDANVEQALRHYQQALTVRTRERFPRQWAASQNGLGEAYAARVAGSRADNLAQARRHYQQALEVFRPDEHPDEWHIIQQNLAALGERMPTSP